VPEVGSRGWWEARLAREFAQVSRARLKELLSIMGSPPRYANVPQNFWEPFESDLRDKLGPAMNEIYTQAAERLMLDHPVGVQFEGMVNKLAADWARTYSFDLVTTISNTNQRYLQRIVGDFYETQMTLGDAWNEIAAYRDFTKRAGWLWGVERAKVIAITEVTRASVAGERQVQSELWDEGVHMIAKWQTRRDEKVCQICGPLDNQLEESAAGWPTIMGRVSQPPAHPRCRCWLVYEHIAIAQSEQPVIIKPPVPAPVQPVIQPPKPMPETPVPEPAGTSARQLGREKHKVLKEAMGENNSRRLVLEEKSKDIIARIKQNREDHYINLKHIREAEQKMKLMVQSGDTASPEYHALKQRIKELKQIAEASHPKYLALVEEGSSIDAARTALRDNARELLVETMGHGKEYTLQDINYLSKFDAGDIRSRSIEQGMDFFHKIVDPDALPASALQFKKGKGSPHYLPWEEGGVQDVIFLPKYSGTSTVTHEMGHWLEEYSDTVHNNILRLLDERAGLDTIPAGKSEVPLDLIIGGEMDSELRYMTNVYKSKYEVDAIHRNYAGGDIYATELMSQFLDLAYSDPMKLSWLDPDVFGCLWASTQNLHWLGE